MSNNGTKDATIEELKATEKKTLSADEARAVLMAEEQAKQQRFIDGYNALVNETGYALKARPILVDGRIDATNDLVETSNNGG